MKKLILFFGILVLGIATYGQSDKHEFNVPIYMYQGAQIGWRAFMIDSIYFHGDTLLFYHNDSIYKVPFVPLSAKWGRISGSLGDQSDLSSELSGKANLNHTHVASDVTDFQTAVSANGDVTNNTIHRNTTSGNPHHVTKSDVGLGNVDNTSDADKPASDAVVDSLSNKVSIYTQINGHFLTGDVNLTSSDVGAASQSALEDTASAIRGDMGTNAAGFKIDSIISDGSNAIMFNAGDTMPPYIPSSGTQNLHDLSPMWPDTTGGSGNKLVTLTYFNSHSTGGGGSDTTFKMSFIVGTTTNAPTAGDSVLKNDGFANKHIEAFRDGLLQFYSTTEGIEHTNTADSITVHPPFASGEKWVIEVADTSGWGTLALKDTSSGGGSTVYTDDFNSYIDGDLDGQGSWVKDFGVITVSSGTIYPNSADSIAYYYNATVANDQYAQLYVDGNSSRSLGVLLRYNESTNSGYAICFGSGNAIVYRIDNGTLVQLAIHYSVTFPLTIRGEISGTTIRVYEDGIQDATIGDITDSNYSSGRIGLFGYDASSVRVGDNFEGGDL